jgi:hypothetical protein
MLAVAPACASRGNEKWGEDVLLFARPAEMRLALLALFSIADGVPDDVCRVAMDRACDAAYAAPVDVLDDDDGEDPLAIRFGAVRALNSLCAACRACPRGRDVEDARGVMMDAPPS